MSIQVRTLVRLKGIKDIIRRRARRSWPVNYDVLTEHFMAPQNPFAMKIEKHGITDVSSTPGDIHHCKIPLLICIWNFSRDRK